MHEDREATIPPVCCWLIDRLVQPEMVEDTRVAIGNRLDAEHRPFRTLRGIVFTVEGIARFAGYGVLDLAANIYHEPQLLLAGAHAAGIYLRKSGIFAAQRVPSSIKRSFHLASCVGVCMVLIVPSVVAHYTGHEDLRSVACNVVSAACGLFALIIPLALAARSRPRSFAELCRSPFVEHVIGPILGITLLIVGLTILLSYRNGEVIGEDILELTGFTVAVATGIVGIPCLLYRLSKNDGRFRVLAASLYAMLMGAGIGAIATLVAEANNVSVWPIFPASSSPPVTAAYDTPAWQWASERHDRGCIRPAAPAAVRIRNSRVGRSPSSHRDLQVRRSRGVDPLEIMTLIRRSLSCAHIWMGQQWS